MPAQVIEHYKSLADIERGFRVLKLPASADGNPSPSTTLQSSTSEGTATGQAIPSMVWPNALHRIESIDAYRRCF